jgi:hypothetical protein
MSDLSEIIDNDQDLSILRQGFKTLYNQHKATLHSFWIQVVFFNG